MQVAKANLPATVKNQIQVTHATTKNKAKCQARAAALHLAAQRQEAIRA